MKQSKKEVCPSRQAFFTLESSYITAVYDGIINLIRHAGWTYRDLYSMPISKRNWIFKRIVELNKAGEKEDE